MSLPHFVPSPFSPTCVIVGPTVLVNDELQGQSILFLTSALSFVTNNESVKDFTRLKVSPETLEN